MVSIDKIFKTSFIDEKFVPLIRDNPPNSTSLGLRIQQLILEDLSHTASLIVGETINNIEYKKSFNTCFFGIYIRFRRNSRNIHTKKGNGTY